MASRLGGMFKMAENQDDVQNVSNTFEGKRWTHLNKALKRTTKMSLSSIKLQLFLRQFAMISKKHPEEVKKLHQEFIEETQQAVDSEIHQILEQESISQLMNHLDGMTSNVAEPQEHPTWRPSGQPEDDLRAHEVTVKLKQKQKLEAILADAQRETDQLERSVMAHRQQLAMMENKVTEACTVITETGDIPTEAMEHFLETKELV